MKAIANIMVHFEWGRPIIKVSKQDPSPYVLTIEEKSGTGVTMLFDSLEELEHIQDALTEGIERLKTA